MKKIVSIVLCICIGCIVTSCKTPLEDMPMYSYGGETACFAYDAETVAELEEHSPNIVQGKLKNDAKEITLDGAGMTAMNITVTTLVVTKVYKGDLKVGDAVPLGENYYKKEVDGVLSLMLLFGCPPIIPQKEYLFFLHDARVSGDIDGVYLTVLMNKGRYPILDDQEKNVAYIQNEDGSRSFFTTLYKEVVIKYMDGKPFLTTPE